LRKFAANEVALASRQRTVSHFLFHQGFFFSENNTAVAPTHHTFLFPRLTIKLKGRHFDTIEVMEAESQAVLNTLTERDSQVAFKKWQKRWERCIRAERDYFERDGGQ
jgi:hypothetical protein